MSNRQDTSSNNREPGDFKVMVSALGYIGVMLIFILIVFLSYISNRPPPINEPTINDRLQTLAEVRDKQQEAAATYGWVDSSRGIVRVPIERAMELTVRKLAAVQEETGAAKEKMDENSVSTP